VQNEVINRQRLVRIDSQQIGSLVRAALDKVGKPDAYVTVAFVRDPAIRDLNLKFRQVDRATDVLSFPDTEEDDTDFVDGRFLGDIVISTDTAKRQAADSGLSIERELSELVIHGVLHLCGYDHEIDNGEMNRLELKLRKKLLD
jgi:probable rRNA maturation factor